MEKSLKHLSTADHRLYKAMQDWTNHVGDMLAHVNDVLAPRRFDEILLGDFATLRQIIARKV
jgi:hypothetical protein